MESWQFIQSPAGEWYWLCSNVISRHTRESAATFQTRMECVANAMSFGYQKMVAGASPAKRSNPNGGAQQERHRIRGEDVPNQCNESAKPSQPATAKRASRRRRNKSGRQPKPN